MRDPHIIIKKILRTEKGSFETELRNKYLFEVDSKANKIEIKRAVEAIYKVKVVKVNTQVTPRKPKLMRRDWGYLPERKKAFVQLDKEQKIDMST